MLAGKLDQCILRCGMGHQIDISVVWVVKAHGIVKEEIKEEREREKEREKKTERNRERKKERKKREKKDRIEIWCVRERERERGSARRIEC